MVTNERLTDEALIELLLLSGTSSAKEAAKRLARRATPDADLRVAAENVLDTWVNSGDGLGIGVAMMRLDAALSQNGGAA